MTSEQRRLLAPLLLCTKRVEGHRHGMFKRRPPRVRNPWDLGVAVAELAAGTTEYTFTDNAWVLGAFIRHMEAPDLMLPPLACQLMPVLEAATLALTLAPTLLVIEAAGLSGSMPSEISPLELAAVLELVSRPLGAVDAHALLTKWPWPALPDLERGARQSPSPLVRLVPGIRRACIHIPPVALLTSLESAPSDVFESFAVLLADATTSSDLLELFEVASAL